MALALHDRVQETTTTAGTGSITLLGAVDGFQSFAVIGDTNTCYYTIVDGTNGWEVGIGTYSTTGPTLARTTVLSNSNGDTSPITLSSTDNTKSVFVTYPAEKSVNLDASGNVSPLGTVASGVWQGTTVGVAYGGTGVTASSGANSVVLRDSNATVFANRVNQGITVTTSSGGTLELDPASTYWQTITGTSAHTVKLPDATAIPVGSAFVIDNDSTESVTVTDYAGDPVDTVAAGGYTYIFLEADGTIAGTWNRAGLIPSEVNWGTNSLDLGGTTVITNGTWQGDPVASGYGGTGLTTFTAANYALYSTSSSALTAGTLPIAAGGTGQTSASAAFNALSPITTEGDLIVGDASGDSVRLPIGANGAYLVSNGTTAEWSEPTTGTYTRTSFILESAQDTFSVSYSVGYLEVFVNGVLLSTDDYVASNGTSVILSSAAATGDVVEFVAYATQLAVLAAPVFPFFKANGTSDPIGILTGNLLPFYNSSGVEKNIALTT